MMIRRFTNLLVLHKKGNSSTFALTKGDSRDVITIPVWLRYMWRIFQSCFKPITLPESQRRDRNQGLGSPFLNIISQLLGIVTFGKRL